MREIRREALVPHTPEQMFELIERVEDYPQFVPWCLSTSLITRTPDSVSATVIVGVRELHAQVTTRNEKRPPEFMAIRMEGGTFRHFYGEWSLRPLGDAGCHIHFMLQYELPLHAETLAGRLIEHAADRMVDAFVRRAVTVYAAAPEVHPPPGQPGAF
jgi:ribosome-associated toxin RatA of RatAB toxin-antitoxin module